MTRRNERILAAAVVLILLAATAGVVWWSRTEEQAVMSDATYIPGPTEITPEILLLRDYVRIDTSTPQGEAAGARWLAAELAKRGVRAELIEAPEGRLNVYARIKGRTAGGGLVLFNHIDVMPPGQGWTKSPFGAEIVLNQMYGRGTQDMKAMAICQLVAFAEVARSGRAPEHDLVYLATADEETGSRYGLRWLLEHRPDVFEGIAFGITEGGTTEVMTERMTYFGVEVGSKQYVSFHLVAPERERLAQARLALEPLMTPHEPQRIAPAVREFFRSVAPTRILYKPLLADIDAAVAAGQFWRLPMAYRDLTQNRLWAGAPVRSDREWSMDVRLINLTDEDPDRRIAAVASIAAPYGVRVGKIEQKEGPVPFSNSDTPLFRILAGEGARRYRTAAGVMVLYRSSSDSRFLRSRGIDCYGVSPYPVDYFQSLSIHGRDERIRLDWYQEGVGYMRAVVGKWAYPSR